MARISTFDARARRQSVPRLRFDDGSAEANASFAQSATDLARRVGTMADAAARREGQAAGREAALAALVPSAGLDPATETLRTAYRGREYTPRNVPNQGGARGAEVRQFFQGIGYSAEAAAAIAGHLQQESNFNTAAIGDQGTAFGLAQWRLDRRDALQSFADSRGRPVDDFETQLHFMAHELATSERRAEQGLREAATLQDATTALMHFFRPAGYTVGNPQAGHGFENRLSFAQALIGDAAPSAPAPVSIELPDAPLVETQSAPAFQLSGIEGTIRGDAFNQAAQEIYLDRLLVTTTTQMDALAIQHANDPQALASALDSYTTGVRGQLDERLVPEFDRAVQRSRLSYVRDATRAMTQRLTQERRAAFEGALATRNGRLARIAAGAGFDDAGDAAVEAELGFFDDFIAAQGDALTPVEAERLRRSAREDVAGARVTGGFDALEGLGERQAFLENFQTRWMSGDASLLDLGPDAYGRITSHMERQIARQETQRDSEARSLSRSASDVISRLESGFPVPASETAALRRRADVLGDPVLADDIRYMEQVGQWTQEAGLRPIAAVDADIATLEQQMAEHGATPRSVALLDTMQSFRDEMDRSLSRDPLGWAQRTGLGSVPPLNFDTPEDLGSSLSARADMAETVAERYGLNAPAYLQEHEREALTTAMVANPASAATMATALARSLGPDGSSQVLMQIADHAPGLAHAAGAVIAGGDPRAVQYVAQERALALDPNYVPPSSEPSLERSVAAEIFGSAFLVSPAVEANTLEAARSIYRQLARERGVSPDLNAADRDTERTSRDIFTRALQMAAGQTLGVDGRAYGGLVEVNGRTTVAPAGFPADQVEAHLRHLSDAQLAEMPATVSANGVPISARQIRRAQLVAVGDGVYRVNLAEPNDPPRFVMGQDGYWTVDIRRLARMQGGVSALNDRSLTPIMP